MRDYIVEVRVANIIKLETTMAVASFAINRQPQSGKATTLKHNSMAEIVDKTAVEVFLGNS